MIVHCALDHTFLRKDGQHFIRTRSDGWNIWPALAKAEDCADSFIVFLTCASSTRAWLALWSWRDRTSVTNPAGVAAILPRQVRRLHLQMTKWSLVQCFVYRYLLRQSSGLPRSVRKKCPWEPAMVRLVSFFKKGHLRRFLDNSWSGVRTCYPNRQSHFNKLQYAYDSHKMINLKKCNPTPYFLKVS